MTSRPKARPVLPALASRTNGEKKSAKDQLLCRLEQEQTVAAETIRQLERSRQDLLTVQANFSLLFERSPIAYLKVDGRGRIYHINASALKLLGYDITRIMRLPLTFLAHKDDNKVLLNHLWCCQHETLSAPVTNLRLRNNSGDYTPVQLITVPLAGTRERRMFMMAIIDRSEPVRDALALAETKEFAEAIVETVRHPLAVLDPDLRIVSVNRAFTEYFRRPAQYIGGRVLEVMLNLWRSGNDLRTELEKVLVKNTTLENYRIEVEPPDLGKRILLVNARQLRQKENAPHRLLVSLEDVTELEQAREQLRESNQELEQRVEARTDALRKSYEQMESFCYSIAHDLRAPLRSMTGFSQLLVDEFADQIGGLGKEYADRIQHSAERMDQLIRDLLSYGRLNTAPLETSTVDLQKVFQEVLMQQEKDIHEKHAKVRRKGRLPVVCGHHAVLHAVLSNLIANALKFVAPDVRPCVDVSAETKDDWVRVWVTDNGIGIAPENRERIFGVFQRLHSADAYPGTGIGLAIVSKGVDRMGGRIGLESEPGKGSRFWFELPVRGGGTKASFQR